MGHLFFFLSEEATRQAWGTAETALLVRLGIVIVLAVLVIGRLVDVHRRHAAERAGREHGESRPRPLERPA
jgi:hypothetical protein